ncbi:MAG: AbiEi antitoxin N-terminal domain-containing protein [Parasporobacterium sp.]|nr:AbiEi antitoxin N-terminal domain-containing protein [Parasporobacterium sp.]
MSREIDYLITESHDGLVRTADIEAHGGSRQSIKKYVEDNILIRVGRGLYQIADRWDDELYTLCERYHRGIVSGETALYIHGFTDRTPSSYVMTFPQGYNSPSLKNENVIIKRVNKDIYEMGLESGKSFNGNPVRIYNLERTLCDIVRGEGSDIQIVLTAMKKYAKYEKKNVNLLFEFAEKLRVKKKIMRYMEVLL